MDLAIFVFIRRKQQKTPVFKRGMNESSVVSEDDTHISSVENRSGFRGCSCILMQRSDNGQMWVVHFDIASGTSE